MIPVMQGRALGIGELHRTSTKGLGNDPSHYPFCAHKRLQIVNLNEEAGK